MLTDFPKYCNRNLYNSIPYSLWVGLKLAIAQSIIKGRQLSTLETSLLEHYGCKHVFLTGSGRLAIYIFLRALREYGVTNHYVLLPFYICPSVPDIVVQAGFTPVFMPIKNDLTLDPGKLSEEALKAVSVVIIPHIYGYPAVVDELVDRIRSANPIARIIDDAASAYNITPNYKKLGTFGDAGILSFSQGKLLNASGGGALLLNDNKLLTLVHKEFNALISLSSREKMKELLKVLWRYGWHSYSDSLSYWSSKILPSPATTKRNFSKMTNLDARLVNDGMNTVSAIHRDRKKIIEHYFNKLREIEGVCFPQQPTQELPPVSRFYMFYSGCSLKVNKDGSIQRHNPLYNYLRERGVKVFYPYLPVDRFWAGYGAFWEDSEWLYSLLGLPVDFRQSIAWHDQVIDIILSYGEKREHGK